jgi:FixJ family two-component response regulator
VGYQTATYTNPKQALADYQPGMASVVVTDVSMPGLDGVALAERIRKLDPGVPVVFVSGYSTEPVPPFEGTIFVKKPFGIGELERALASLPDRARAKLE